MILALTMLLGFSPAVSVEIPRDAGLYCLTPQGLAPIEGRSVTVEGDKSKVRDSLPGVGSQAKAEILGGHAAQRVMETPVFWYRVPSGAGIHRRGRFRAGYVKPRKNLRDFTISEQSEWKAERRNSSAVAGTIRFAGD